MRDKLAEIIADERNGGDPYDIAEAIISALPGMVKPLVFERITFGKRSFRPVKYARGACGRRYYVSKHHGFWIAKADMNQLTTPEGSRKMTEDQAIAACNAEHARRTLSAFGITDTGGQADG